MPPRGRPSSSHSSHRSSSSHRSASSSGARSSSHRSYRSRYRTSKSGNSRRSFETGSVSYGRRHSASSVIGCLTAVILAGAVGLYGVFLRNTEQTGSNSGKNTYSSVAEQETIYVPALERDVPWSEEYDCYYDSQTDCYFFLNTEAGIWQYWFEAVSAEYGDYGWMEWDEAEQQWYVQIGTDAWTPLPEQDHSVYLWHFD